MNKISSDKITSYNKVAMPIMSVFIIALFSFILIPKGDIGFVKLVAIGLVLLIAILVFRLLWQYSFKVADAVYDAGDHLIIRKRNKKIQVSLNKIKNISYSNWVTAGLAGVSFKEKTELGDEVTFYVSGGWNPFGHNNEIKDIIDRVSELNG